MQTDAPYLARVAHRLFLADPILGRQVRIPALPLEIVKELAPDTQLYFVASQDDGETAFKPQYTSNLLRSSKATEIS